MYRDIGESELEYANDANIPVICFLHEPDEDNPLWRWTADNFMPRKATCWQGAYEIEAETKEEILEAINKYVAPLYEAALKNLKEKGENYYWEAK